MNSMKETLASLSFNDKPVRMVTRDGEPWWVAADVCAVLEISNHHHAVHGRPGRSGGGLDDDEKGGVNVTTPSGVQEMLAVNESGLYSLIMKSKKPEAKAFKRWVTHEVLPSIRKTGIYMADDNPAIAPVFELVRQIGEFSTRLAAIEDDRNLALAEALTLPAPELTVLPELSAAGYIHKAARLYCRASGVGQGAFWRMVYDDVKDLYHVDLTRRAKNARWRGSIVNYAIQHGHADKVYSVILKRLENRLLPVQRAA